MHWSIKHVSDISGRVFLLPSASNKSISFVWQYLKDECFIPGRATSPHVILGDWAAGLIASNRQLSQMSISKAAIGMRLKQC